MGHNQQQTKYYNIRIWELLIPFPIPIGTVE